MEKTKIQDFPIHSTVAHAGEHNVGVVIGHDATSHQPIIVRWEEEQGIYMHSPESLIMIHKGPLPQAEPMTQSNDSIDRQPQPACTAPADATVADSIILQKHSRTFALTSSIRLILKADHFKYVLWQNVLDFVDNHSTEFQDFRHMHLEADPIDYDYAIKELLEQIGHIEKWAKTQFVNQYKPATKRPINA